MFSGNVLRGNFFNIFNSYGHYLQVDLLLVAGPKIDIDSNTPVSTILRLNCDFSKYELFFNDCWLWFFAMQE